MNVHDFLRKKQQQQKITMLTCYDYPSACIVAESAIDCVLVGDSVAMTVHGHPSTLMATMEMMVMHTAAVSRGLSKQQFLISDLPFLSHRVSRADTVKNVRRLLQAGANAIKMEGADENIYSIIRYLVQSGIPVMGHLGLTPQSVHQLGGYKVQGKNPAQAEALLQQSLQLEAAGCFALVIECVPYHLTQAMTQALTIPTIGIGAGAAADGQVLVWHDLLGLHSELKPRFVKQFAQGKVIMLDAINTYVEAIKQATFPTPEHAY